MDRRIVIFLSTLMLCACSGGEQNVQVKSLNGHWQDRNALTFTYDIKDSQRAKNIIFVVRNNNDYPYANLRLIAEISGMKTGKKQTDTLNYILAEPNGKWIGSGFGETKETLFQYLMDYRFPENGTYQITVKQAMRQKNLRGIEDFGIKVEPAKP